MSSMINIRLDDEMRQRLDHLASVTDRTRSHLVKKAIEGYLQANEWQVHAIAEAVRLADKSDAKFIEQGSVDAWLSSWGKEDETERPR